MAYVDILRDNGYIGSVHSITVFAEDGDVEPAWNLFMKTLFLMYGTNAVGASLKKPIRHASHVQNVHADNFDVSLIGDGGDGIMLTARYPILETFLIVLQFQYPKNYTIYYLKE